jgi:hypothetical protein
VTLRSDGTADYWGRSNAARSGHFHARVGARFNYLVYWARELRVLDLEPTYSFAVVDAQDTYVSFVKDGKRRILLDSGSLGPVPLYAYECLIDSVAERLDWQPVSMVDP